MKKTVAVLLTLAFCAGFIACRSQLIITEDVLVGTWVTPVESQNLNRYTEYTFKEDGSGNYRIYQDGEASERIDFSYKLKDAELTLTTGGSDTVYNTVYDGSALIISRDNESVKLTKQGK